MEQNRLAVPLVLLVVLLLKKADIFISSSTKLDDRIFVPSSNLNKRENAKENARCLQRSTPWYNTAWHKYSPGQPGLGTLPEQRGWPRRPPETHSKVIHSIIPLRCLSLSLQHFWTLASDHSAEGRVYSFKKSQTFLAEIPGASHLETTGPYSRKYLL